MEGGVNTDVENKPEKIGGWKERIKTKNSEKKVCEPECKPQEGRQKETIEMFRAPDKVDTDEHPAETQWGVQRHTLDLPVEGRVEAVLEGVGNYSWGEKGTELFYQPMGDFSSPQINFDSPNRHLPSDPRPSSTIIRNLLLGLRPTQPLPQLCFSAVKSKD